MYCSPMLNKTWLILSTWNSQHLNLIIESCTINENIHYLGLFKFYDKEYGKKNNLVNII